MKISRTVTYALKATLQLAQTGNETTTSCAKLAKQGNMPERFLLQILRSLVNHGILHSTRGADGGYVLQKPPHSISVLDVMEALEGPVVLDAAFGQGLTEKSRRRLTDSLRSVAKATRRQLATIKLSDLISEGTTACQPGGLDAKVHDSVGEIPLIPLSDNTASQIHGITDRSPLHARTANRGESVGAGS